VKKLILEYTKISDSPGSGTWTPSGVPAVHYSTEEQVVGTWMNKPLYQRTFTLSSATVDKSNSVSIPNDLENIKRVFLCDSSVYDVTDNRYYPLPYRRKTTSEDLFISLMRLSSETVSIQIVTNQSSSYILQDIAVTIRYTKTTD
ncbi:MAG: hypothetical protein IJ716_14680, partial [Lachnospiraceae bacterium]|nr:hypothetical protein [Lachnospiraceae bacterium]